MKPPHANRVVMLSCECSAAEREVLDRMKTAVMEWDPNDMCRDLSKRKGTDANLVRIALWSLADYLEVEMGPTVFDLRGHGGRGRRRLRMPNPKIRQHAPLPQIPRRPAPDHPWRRPIAPARKVGA
jgi:hypothetical protein